MVVVCIAIACGTSAVNWYCGVVVLWYCSVVVLWCCGVVVLWCCGIVVFVVLWYLWYLWYCGIGYLRLRCARGTPAVRLWCGGCLQRDGCRLVVVVVYSIIVVDWL